MQTRLQELDLESNSLTSLPVSSFAGLTSLRRLNAMDNWIGELDEELLGDATDLRFIDLRNNALTALPERFLKAASRLEHVHLGSNFLKVFDASLFSASTLSLIDVSDNQVTIRLLVCASLPKVSVPWMDACCSRRKPCVRDAR